MKGVEKITYPIIVILAWCKTLNHVEAQGNKRISMAPTPLIRGDHESTEMFGRYIELFFASVPRSNLSDIRFHWQYPPVRLYSIPPEFLDQQSLINRVDFNQLQGMIADPFEAILEGMRHVGRSDDLNALQVNVERMKLELVHILSQPRSVETHPKLRELIGGYLYQTMGTIGLLVGMHDFKHELPIRQYAEQFGETLESVFEEGTNVIGILPGKFFNSAMDRPIIVGAHWDVVANTSGFNDNGSGLTTLMEVARVVTMAQCFEQDYSVIFVAFDSEEVGSIGSLKFIQQYVMPSIDRGGAQVQAVFIVDTIANYDPNPMQQDIDESWWDVAPDTAHRVQKKGLKGDFVALIGRNLTADRNVMDLYLRHYNNTRFPVEPFELSHLPASKFPSKKELADHGYFWLSDNSRFWFYKENDAHTTFPTVLLTDTAFKRGYMRECYHEPCDDKTNPNITNQGFDFMANVAQALVYAIVEMSSQSKSQCQIPEFDIPHFEKQPKQQVETTAANPEMSHLSKPTQIPVEDSLEYFDGAANQMDHDVSNTLEHSMSEDMLQGLSKGQVQALFLKFLKHAQLDEDLIPFKKKPSHWFSADNSPNVRYNIGTQINIGSLNLGFSSGKEQQTDSHLYQGIAENKPDIILGSKDVNSNVLSNIIQSYYNAQASEPATDRRAYQGKYKNSPMIIKLVEQTSKFTEEL